MNALSGKKREYSNIFLPTKRSLLTTQNSFFDSPALFFRDILFLVSWDYDWSFNGASQSYTSENSTMISREFEEKGKKRREGSPKLAFYRSYFKMTLISLQKFKLFTFFVLSESWRVLN